MARRSSAARRQTKHIFQICADVLSSPVKAEQLSHEALSGERGTSLCGTCLSVATAFCRILPGHGRSAPRRPLAMHWPCTGHAHMLTEDPSAVQHSSAQLPLAQGCVTFPALPHHDLQPWTGAAGCFKASHRSHYQLAAVCIVWLLLLHSISQNKSSAQDRQALLPPAQHIACSPLPFLSTPHSPLDSPWTPTRL